MIEFYVQADPVFNKRTKEYELKISEKFYYESDNRNFKGQPEIKTSEVVDASVIRLNQDQYDRFKALYSANKAATDEAALAQPGIRCDVVITKVEPVVEEVLEPVEPVVEE